MRSAGADIARKARWGVYSVGRVCLSYFARKEPPPLVRYIASNTVDGEVRRASLRLLNDLEAERERATVDKFEYIRESLPNVPWTTSRWAVLETALQQVSVDGVYAEFGVADGQSLRFICQRVPRPVYGFDSFQGLSENWLPGAWKGTFARPAGTPPEVLPNAVVVSGFFNKTLPGFIQSIGERPIAFLHMDADLYSSTSTVLSALRDHVRPSTILVFDEYFGYPGWRSNGEFRAFAEFIQATGYRFEYLACNAAGQQVAMRLLPK